MKRTLLEISAPWRPWSDVSFHNQISRLEEQTQDVAVLRLRSTRR